MASNEYERSTVFPGDADNTLSSVYMTDRGVQVESTFMEDTLAAKVHQLQKQNVELADESDKVYNALDSAKNETAVLTRRCTMLTKSNSSLKEELRVARQSVELQISLLQQGEDLHLNDVDRYRQKNKAQAEEIVLLRSKIDSLQDEIKCLRNEINLKNHILEHSQLGMKNKSLYSSSQDILDAHASCEEEIKKLRESYREAEQKIKDLEDELNCVLTPNGRLHRTHSSLIEPSTGICLLQEIKSLMSLTASVLSLHHCPQSPMPPIRGFDPVSSCTTPAMPATPLLRTVRINNNSETLKYQHNNSSSGIDEDDDNFSSECSDDSSIARPIPLTAPPLAEAEDIGCFTPPVKEKLQHNTGNHSSSIHIWKSERRTKHRTKYTKCFRGFRDCIWGVK